MAHGDFAWNELMTSDVEAAKAFYGELLGWEAKAWPMPDGGTYWLWRRDERDLGGAFKMEGPQFEDTPPQWMVYVTVDDCDAACARIGELGGKVMQPPFDVPDVGRIAMVADPAGAVFGIMTPLARD